LKKREESPDTEDRHASEMEGSLLEITKVQIVSQKIYHP